VRKPTLPLLPLHMPGFDAGSLDHPLLRAARTSSSSSSSSTSGTGSSTRSGSDGSSKATPYAHLYPINALRNLALRHATTPLVLLVDADFIPCSQLVQALHAPSPYASIAPPCDSSSSSASSGSADTGPAAAAARAPVRSQVRLVSHATQGT
jgi:hypothetical protein